MDHFGEVLELFRLPRPALLADLDGTLSQMVERPEEAAVSPEVRNALAALHRRLVLVAVITGRAARDALDIVGLPQLTYVGNHGMERIEAGKHQVAPEFRPYASEVQDAICELRATIAIPGVWLEDKLLSLSLHYRHAQDQGVAHRRILQAIASLPNRARFRIIEGKRVVNLLPALAADKGSAASDLVRRYRLSGALFMGDDITDLDAFRSIQELRRGHRFRGINVAVLGEDVESEVEKEADFTLRDVTEVSRFLTRLVKRLA